MVGQVTMEVNVPEPGKLKSQISGGDAKKIECLVVTGVGLDAKDLIFIQKMPALKTLDFHNTAKGINIKDLKKPVTNVQNLIIKEGNYNDLKYPTSVNEELPWIYRLTNQAESVRDRANGIPTIFPNVQQISTAPIATMNLAFLPERVWWNNNIYFQRNGMVVWTKEGYNSIKVNDQTDVWIDGGTSNKREVAKNIDLSGSLYVCKDAYPSGEAEKLIIPQETRYIAEEAFVGTYTVVGCNFDQIVTEETDQPLYIGKRAFSTYGRQPKKAKHIIFNRPVYIEDNAFENCDLNSLIFNSDVEYIGKNAFGGATSITFKKVPKKIDKDFVSRQNFAEISIPASTEDKFASFGLNRNNLYEVGGELLTLNIKMDKPGTILSKIPSDKLSRIGSLTITGYLYETDIQILSQLRSMTYLDISKTYTTFSPAYIEKLRNEQRDNALVLKMLGNAAKESYYNGNNDGNNYIIGQMFADIDVEKAVDKSEPGCILPDNAFRNLRRLETIKLPLLLSTMGNNVLRACVNLKHVEMPPHLQSIGIGSFAYCSKMEDIKFPASVEYIGESLTVEKHACAFDYSGIKVLDLSQCVFTNNEKKLVKDSWGICLRECNNLQVVKLPSNIIWVSTLMIKPNVDYYFPATLKGFLQGWSACENAKFHFKSPNPPDIGNANISNSTIYCPINSTTAYYSAFGSNNKYVEE
jgi:hypothetical protein